MARNNARRNEWKRYLKETSPIKIFQNIDWDNAVKHLSILWEKELRTEIKKPQKKALQNRTKFLGNN